MVLRLAVAAVLLAAAAGVAGWLRGRRPEAPTRDRMSIPVQLDRGDFPRPDAPWLVVLFSSATCEGCAVMAERVAALESADVAVYDAEYSARPDLHRRYAVEAVPLVVLAGPDGVTRASFLGAARAADLGAAVAEAHAAGPA